MNGPDIIFFLVMLFQLIVCPYNKVEESFNTQASHDIIFYGPNIGMYDHLEFPGVVPRSFIGPLFLATMSSPFVALFKAIGLNKFASQLLIRLVLGLTTWHAFKRYQAAIGLKFGQNVTKWLTIITCTQFHFMFYMTRTLPNTFALVLSLHALAFVIKRNHLSFIFSAACGIIIFRSELAIIMGCYLISELMTKLRIVDAIKYSIPAGLLWIFFTVFIDSYFWRRWVWPEAEVFYFNTILNKSSMWGTSPFFWYFYSAIPRALASTIFFIPFGFYLEPGIRPLFLPAIVYVAFYSFLPHKELRFIIYVFPIFNTVAAAACTRFWRSMNQSFFKKILAVLVISHLALNTLFSGLLLYISSLNYPGGQAMDILHKIESRSSPVYVHVDTAAAETGVSRFTELFDNWSYSKKEGIISYSEEMLGFTHILTEPGDNNENLRIFNKTHSVMSVIQGHPQLELDLNAFPWIPIRLSMKPAIYILKRNL